MALAQLVYKMDLCHVLQIKLEYELILNVYS